MTLPSGFHTPKWFLSFICLKIQNQPESYFRVPTVRDSLLIDRRDLGPDTRLAEVPNSDQAFKMIEEV